MEGVAFLHTGLATVTGDKHTLAIGTNMHDPIFFLNVGV